MAKRLIFIVLFLGLGFVVTLLVLNQLSGFAPQKPPSDFLLTKNFVNINQIASISKFRSCQGHVHIPRHYTGPKSNMKHYFQVKDGIPAEKVAIYAPFDGKLLDFPIGELMLFPASSGRVTNSLSEWYLGFDHVKRESSLGPTATVKAGQVIGYFDNTGTSSFDVLIAVAGFPPKSIDGWMSPQDKLDSVFRYMSKEVFAEYQRPDATKPENYIISESDRSTQPCQYRGTGPQFEPQPHNTLPDRVAL